jgi:hypothetical protein
LPKIQITGPKVVINWWAKFAKWQSSGFIM